MKSTSAVRINSTNSQFNNMRPLTNAMIELLMDCHEKELMYLSPNHGTMRNGASLTRRKLLTTRAFKEPEGKNLICLYTTQLGRTYLSNMIESLFPTLKSRSRKNETILKDLNKKHIMSNTKDQIKKDAHKAEKKMEHVSHEIADKTKDAAEKVKSKAEDLGHSIKKKME